MSASQLKEYKKVHMVGIKGAGMTALAQILKREGVHITGSDTEEKFFTDAVLKSLGIAYVENFAPENIPADTELVVYSTAYQPLEHPELQAAQEKGLPLLSYPEAVGQLSREKLTLAVAGTHGKTTTSALLGEALRFLGKDPVALVGSRIHSWEGCALSGGSEYFVLEADEYQDKLAYYQPFGVILTSVDWDHPDFFPDVASYEDVFGRFVARIPQHGFLIYCSDSARVQKVAKRAVCRTLSYGFLPGADYRITHYEPIVQGMIPDQRAPKQRFALEYGGEDLGEFVLQLAGRHNALNATSVVAVLSLLKLDLLQAKAALQKFSGTARRLELIGERYGALVYDDYAHHPEEIRATLAALRELYPTRHIRAIFQPHTFSRTAALFSEFVQSFEAADEVVVLPIYASAREEAGAVSSEELASRVNTFFPGKARAATDIQGLIAEYEGNIGRQDIIITLGAGMGWQIAESIAKKKK